MAGKGMDDLPEHWKRADEKRRRRIMISFRVKYDADSGRHVDVDLDVPGARQAPQGSAAGEGSRAAACTAAQQRGPAIDTALHILVVDTEQHRWDPSWRPPRHSAPIRQPMLRAELLDRRVLNR